MGKSRSRRRRSANRRLPNSTHTSTHRSVVNAINRMSALQTWDFVMYQPKFQRTPVAPKLYQPKAHTTGLRPPPLYNPKQPTNAPLRRDVCVKRSIRQEVMHAVGKAGKAGQNKPIFRKSSKVRC